jgi:UTP--glucose-1-phosphate uridylyltransferase
MKNYSRITKAVIAAAGTGTRFLPATKNQPKEMLPIIDKPIIHYLVEEAVASGIEDIILVTKQGSHIVEDYFDNRVDLEYSLEKSGKDDKLGMVRDIPQMANFVYVRQKSHLPYGNGSPLLAVKDLIDNDESFVYMFGDDLTLSDVPVTKQLIDVFHEQKADAVLGAQEVPWEEVERYGTVKYKENANYKYEIEMGLEKLPRDQAPSNIVQFGRFVFSYDVIETALSTSMGKDNELWVIDILNKMAQEGKKVIAQPINGEWLTTGDPLRYLKATLKFAMRREDLKDDLKKFIKDEIFTSK